MRPALCVVLVVAVLALAGAAHPAQRAAPPSVSASGSALVVDGQPYFPIFAWAACPQDVERDLAAGVSAFMTHGECSEDALLTELGQRAYYVAPIDGGRDFGSDPRLLGYTQPDEPDGHEIFPEQLSLVPGRFVFMTLTAHFAQELGPLPDPFGKSIYPAYAARADGLGFDLYPLSHLCGHAVVSLGSVYHDQRDLVALAGDRPTFQWLETGSLEGACGAPVTPAAVHAEAWLAIAGGARGIGYFTYGWPDGKATSFAVADDVAAALARTSLQIKSLARTLLAPSVRSVSSTRYDPIKIGARRYDGRTYVIAVNSFDVPMQWSRTGLPGLKSQRVQVVGESRSRVAWKGALRDSFPALGVHVYAYKP